MRFRDFIKVPSHQEVIIFMILYLTDYFYLVNKMVCIGDTGLCSQGSYNLLLCSIRKCQPELSFKK